MATILIADDHPAIRDVLKQLLSSHSHIVIETEYGADVVEMAQHRPPDMVVIDVEMEPGWSAKDTARTLKAMGIQVVVFTGHSEYKHVHDMLDARVDGYLLKSERMPAIVDEIDRILSGTRRYSSRLTEVIAGSSDDGAVATFVLQLLADDLTVREIAHDMHVSERTVRNYIDTARKRFGVCTVCAAVAKALRQGEIA